MCCLGLGFFLLSVTPKSIIVIVSASFIVPSRLNDANSRSTVVFWIIFPSCQIQLLSHLVRNRSIASFTWLGVIAPVLKRFTSGLISPKQLSFNSCAPDSSARVLTSGVSVSADAPPNTVNASVVNRQRFIAPKHGNTLFRSP